MQTRALDHVVLPCGDLTAAAQAFEAMGFLVGGRNRHPWGTENQIIQVPGAFIELIALAPDYKPLAPDHEAFPFAGFLAHQAGSHDPSGMIVLRSTDADADARAFQTSGIGRGRMLHFSRSGTAPDGTSRTVAFSLAFGEAPSMPDLGFFVCQQHNPENFWNPAMQGHPNGVTGLTAVVIGAERPVDHAQFLSRFAGPPRFAIGVMSISLGDGSALLVEPAKGPPRIAALRFRTTGQPSIRKVGGITVILAP